MVQNFSMTAASLRLRERTMKRVVSYRLGWDLAYALAQDLGHCHWTRFRPRLLWEMLCLARVCLYATQEVCLMGMDVLQENSVEQWMRWGEGRDG